MRFVVPPLSESDIATYMKGSQVKILTDQQIFDKAAQFVYKNKLCVDWALDYDQQMGIHVQSSSEVGFVNFNSDGRRCILFSFLTEEDFRYLNKTQDYRVLKHFLTRLDIQACAAEKVNAFKENREMGELLDDGYGAYDTDAIEVYRDMTSPDKQAALALIDRLEARGFPAWALVDTATTRILEAEEACSDYLVGRYHKDPDTARSSAVSYRYVSDAFVELRNIARSYGLKPDVLKLSP